MNLLKYIVGFAMIPTVLSASCDHLGVSLYEDLGCTPHYEDSKICPVKYLCEGLEESEKYCYFRGRAYKNEESVDESVLDLSCDRACTCANYDGSPSFVCAILDCPEWLGAPIGDGCYQKYSIGECCAVGEVCPPFDNIEKCIVDGKEYKEGENFYPNNTCLHCVCQKGFTGKLEEPFCRKLSCGVQLRSGRNLKKLCAPWYDKNSNNGYCCPLDWICPDGTEVIKGDTTSGEVCQFGNKTLKIGQTFEKFNVSDNFGKVVPKVECSCVIPPLLICTEAD